MEIETTSQDPYFNFLENTLIQLDKLILSKDQRQINFTLLSAEKYRKSIRPHHIEYLNQKLQLNLSIDFKCNVLN